MQEIEIPMSGVLDSTSPRETIEDFRPFGSGTGFFITEDGYLITNEHVAGNGAQVRLVTEAGLISAKVVKVDAANDLALLKAEGKFAPLPVVSSRAVKMGSTVATVGFPNIGLQGFAPKLAKGEIAALSGAQDDPRYFQISVPVQPGNSGGALVDERGNVVGVVSAKLSVAAAVATSGALPENVNYAVKSSFLLSFLESVPEVAAKLKRAEHEGSEVRGRGEGRGTSGGAGARLLGTAAMDSKPYFLNQLRQARAAVLRDAEAVDALIHVFEGMGMFLRHNTGDLGAYEGVLEVSQASPPTGQATANAIPHSFWQAIQFSAGGPQLGHARGSLRTSSGQPRG